MHPAYSVIFFTTASGAGFGLLALLGVLGPLGLVPSHRGFGLAALAIALGLAGAGLVSSTFHLRRPRRAIYAFAQWRSSWLSREGVASIATFLPAGVLALGWVVFETTGGAWSVAGVLAAVGALATVYSTGMIYAVLKPIRQWHDPLVVPVYLLFALATGAVWLAALLAAGAPGHAGACFSAVAALAAAWAVKAAYWRRIDAGAEIATRESTIGLGGTTGRGTGTVRPLLEAHTEENYLRREMGYAVARKHARKLRLVAALLGGALPTLLLILAALLPGLAAAIVAALAVAPTMAGVLVERWLFFAEARHTVMLYY